MRKPLFTLLLCILLPAGCDGSNGSRGMDASAVDSGVTDAGEDDAAPGSDPDGGSMDADVAECDATQHRCGATCTDPMPNLPGNGCRLGCGDPCPGGGDALCTDDGECDVLDCTPTTCEALGASCGTVDDGCGDSLGCGTCEGALSCVDHECVCTADPFDLDEDNGTTATATTLGTLTDDPDSSMSVTTATLHDEFDDDWYRVAIDNTGVFGAPEITVTLTDLPPGTDYHLGAFYDCPDGDAPTCTMGELNGSRGSGGCLSLTAGDDTVAFDTNCGPDGVLFVHVNRLVGPASCTEPYRLDITVE